jgi:hypothetical protein
MRLKNPVRRLAGMSKKDHGALPAPMAPAPGAFNIFHNVGFVHQNHINLCGDACTSMLLLYRGKMALAAVDPSPKHANVFLMRDNPRGVLTGSNTGTLIAGMKGANLQVYDVSPQAGAAWTAQTLGDALTTFGPVMICVAFSAAAYHWILLTGIQNSTIFYHDPWRGRNMSMTVANLARISTPQYANECLAALNAPVVGPPGTLSCVLR